MTRNPTSLAVFRFGFEVVSRGVLRPASFWEEDPNGISLTMATAELMEFDYVGGGPATPRIRHEKNSRIWKSYVFRLPIFM